MSGPEFGGNDSEELPAGVPTVFLYAPSGNPSVGVSAIVPPGQSWIVEGVDCCASGVGAGYMTASAGVSPGANDFLLDARPISPTQPSATISWRGRIVLGPGQQVTVTTSCSVGGGTCFGTVWGTVLPFVV
jgi:hypothetical protein